jgi:hypothetical protein
MSHTTACEKSPYLILHEYGDMQDFLGFRGADQNRTGVLWVSPKKHVRFRSVSWDWDGGGDDGL